MVVEIFSLATFVVGFLIGSLPIEPAIKGYIGIGVGLVLLYLLAIQFNIV